MNRTRPLFAAAFCGVAISLAPAPEAAMAQPAPLAITVALSSSSLAYGGLRIAEQMNLFQKHGLQPRIVVLDSGSAATAALIGKSAEFAGSGPAEVLAARAKGIDVRIITNVYRGFAAPITLSSTTVDKLNVKRDAPLTDRFKALDGLTIAVPSATSALLAPVRGSAEKAGATPRFIYMAQPAMSAALEAGAIQGFVGSSPYWVTAALKKSGVVWINAPRGELPAEFQPASSAVLQALAAYANANPETIERVRAVFRDLATVIKEQPAVAFDALAKAYPQVDKDTLKLSFEEDAENWSSPGFTAENVKQEISLLSRTIDLPGLKTLDPNDVLQR